MIDLSDVKLNLWKSVAQKWPEERSMPVNPDVVLSLVVEVKRLRDMPELADIPIAYADEHNQYVWWNSNAETAEAIKERGFTPLNKIRAAPADGEKT